MCGVGEAILRCSEIPHYRVVNESCVEILGTMGPHQTLALDYASSSLLRLVTQSPIFYGTIEGGYFILHRQVECIIQIRNHTRHVISKCSIFMGECVTLYFCHLASLSPHLECYSTQYEFSPYAAY